MPRPNRPSPARGRGRGRGENSRESSFVETSFVPFADTSVLPGYGIHNLSMQAEALSTQRHQTSGGSDQRLRYTRVNFISAGDVQPSKSVNSESAMANMSLDPPPANGIDQSADSLGTSYHHSPGSFVEFQPIDGFFIDTKGTLPIITGPPPQIGSHSPTPSNSSDEVILFGGRDRTGRGIQRAPGASSDTANSSDTKIKAIKDTVPQQNDSHQLASKEAENESAYSGAYRTSIVLRSLLEARMAFPGSEKRNKKKKKKKCTRFLDKRQRRRSGAGDDYLIADYIANMDEQSQDNVVSFGHRELGGTDNDLWEETDGTSGEQSARPGNTTNSWGPAELRDFNDLSTSEEILGPVHAVLSKRDRPSGRQYLVQWDGHSVDEARWIPQAKLIDAHALAQITRYEAGETLASKFFSRGDDGDSESDGQSDNEKETDESQNDERDLVQRRNDHMTDEKIARLLSKQEELGLGSDKLVLFDDSADEEEIEEVFNLGHVPKQTRRRPRNSKKPSSDFPTATTLADAYDGFDVMDFDRPSLKKKPRGRKGRIAFDLSDSDLEASMQTAWENDREKKKGKRQEREELRVQGLLGKKQQKPDLKSKYKEGMGIQSVKDEIKSFLIGNGTTLALPPMDKVDRKIVHDLANSLNLKSKSMGSGQKRFPVLYRTSRTTAYEESAFAAAEHRLTRRFLPRLDLKGRRGPSVPNRSVRGGFGNAALGYRDGDVVGGSAPELGAENKGRAMLEKMGWSTGTALGALNNKGILEPVSHVVKTTKAGLG